MSLLRKMNDRHNAISLAIDLYIAISVGTGRFDTYCKEIFTTKACLSAV